LCPRVDLGGDETDHRFVLCRSVVAHSRRSSSSKQAMMALLTLVVAVVTLYTAAVSANTGRVAVWSDASSFAAESSTPAYKSQTMDVPSVLAFLQSPEFRPLTVALLAFQQKIQTESFSPFSTDMMDLLTLVVVVVTLYTAAANASTPLISYLFLLCVYRLCLLRFFYVLPFLYYCSSSH
jgi:hypothetical protein